MNAYGPGRASSVSELLLPQPRTVINRQTKDRYTKKGSNPVNLTPEIAHLSVLMTPCMNPYLKHTSTLIHRTLGGTITHTCQPATILAFLFVTSRTNFLPQAVLFSPSHSTPSNFSTFLPTHSPNVRRPSQWDGCWCPPMKKMFAGGFRASKDPTRRKEGAILVAMQAASTRSR